MVLVAMLVAVVVSWLVFPFFLSAVQKRRTSPVNMFLNRVVFSVAVAFAVGFYVSLPPESAATPPKAESPPSAATNSPVPIAPPAEAPKPAAESSPTVPSAPAKSSPPSESSAVITKVESPPTGSDSPPAPGSETRTFGEMTKEDVEKLEIEKGYSGDDPHVRRRLGLPPKVP